MPWQLWDLPGAAFGGGVLKREMKTTTGSKAPESELKLIGTGLRNHVKTIKMAAAPIHGCDDPLLIFIYPNRFCYSPVFQLAA